MFYFVSFSGQGNGAIGKSPGIEATHYLNGRVEGRRRKSPKKSVRDSPDSGPCDRRRTPRRGMPGPFRRFVGFFHHSRTRRACPCRRSSGAIRHAWPGGFPPRLFSVKVRTDASRGAIRILACSWGRRRWDRGFYPARDAARGLPSPGSTPGPIRGVAGVSRPGSRATKRSFRPPSRDSSSWPGGSGWSSSRSAWARRSAGPSAPSASCTNRKRSRLGSRIPRRPARSGRSPSDAPRFTPRRRPFWAFRCRRHLRPHRSDRSASPPRLNRHRIRPPLPPRDRSLPRLPGPTLRPTARRDGSGWETNMAGRSWPGCMEGRSPRS